MLDEVYKLLQNVFTKKHIPNLIHSSFVGSRGKVRAIKDIDIYVVLKEVNFELFNIVKDQIENSSIQKSLNILRLEFRRGPFKLNNPNLIQIHILVDTLATILQGNFLTKRTWARQGIKISGIELGKLLDSLSFSKSDILKSCKSEIEEMIKGLKDMSIPYREWVDLQANAKLVTKWKAIESGFELKEYLKDCILSPLKHYIEITCGIGTDSVTEIIDQARMLKYEYSKNINYILKTVDHDAKIEKQNIELTISMLKEIVSFYESQI